VQATWDDVPHLSADAKEDLSRSYLPHERDARMRGIPSLGAGAIYPVPESEIVVPPFKIPHFWKCCYALDVGWNRTAALWAALDTETDVAYLVSEHYRAHAEPPIHAEAIKARGVWVPGVIDPAARGRSQRDGEALLTIYRQLGLRLTLADNSVEAGIYETWTRLSTGRLKVFSTLANFLAEYRLYRRDEKGKIVKENDHLMDDCRYICLSGLDRSEFRPPELVRGQMQRAPEWSPRAALDADGYGR
jgi:Terminase RNaseH-like domain